MGVMDAIGGFFDTITGNNASFEPVPSYNFVLLVEGMYYLPLKSVHVFTKENEYEYIQEGGVNDYVHMKRKPISKPFTFQIEKYIDTGVTRFLDPLSNGTELVLPCILFVYRSAAARGWNSDIDAKAYAARYYTFTNCVVTSKEYGELNSEKSGLMTETVTIAYKELIVITNPIDSSTKEEPWTFEKGMNVSDAKTYDAKTRRKDGKFSLNMKTTYAKQSPNDFNVSGNNGYIVNNKTIMDNTGTVKTDMFEIPKDYDASKRVIDNKYGKIFKPVNAEQSKQDMGNENYKGYSLNSKTIITQSGEMKNKVFEMKEEDKMKEHQPMSENIRVSKKDKEKWTLNESQKPKDMFEIPKDYKADKRRDNGQYSTVFKPISAVQSPNDMGNENYKGYMVNGKMITDLKGNTTGSSFEMKDEMNKKPHKPISDNVAVSDQDGADWRINNSQSTEKAFDMTNVDSNKPKPATSHVSVSKKDSEEWGINEKQKAGATFEMSSVDLEMPKPMSSNIQTSSFDKPLATPVIWPPTRRALMAEALSKK